MENIAWYSVVSLSSNPELHEKIPFGLIVYDGRRLSLEIGRDIGHSFKFLPQNTSLAFQFMASALEQSLLKSESFEVIIKSFGPQFDFGNKTPIIVPITKNVISQLINGWFGVDSGAKVHKIESVKYLRIDSIESTLRSIAPQFGTKLLPKASPNQLGYRLRDRQEPEGEGQVDYAISGTNKDLLLSAIDLKIYESDKGKIGTGISKKTINVSKAFWFWKNHRDELQRRANKKFRTIGVVLNGVQNEELRDWGDYINHIWKQDCDSVFTLHDRELMGVLQNEVDWVLK